MSVFPREEVVVVRMLLIAINRPRCDDGIRLEIYGLFPNVSRISPNVNTIIDTIYGESVFW